jgi:hypothetical protein
VLGSLTVSGPVDVSVGSVDVSGLVVVSSVVPMVVGSGPLPVSESEPTVGSLVIDASEPVTESVAESVAGTVDVIGGIVVGESVVSPEPSSPHACITKVERTTA